MGDVISVMMIELQDGANRGERIRTSGVLRPRAIAVVICTCTGLLNGGRLIVFIVAYVSFRELAEHYWCPILDCVLVLLRGMASRNSSP